MKQGLEPQATIGKCLILATNLLLLYSLFLDFQDKDGFITKAEMEKLSKNLSKEQIDKVFARFDSDGDGRLSYVEFRKMMTKEK